VTYDRAVDSSLIVRPARVQDVRQMARVHVRCWQETYRGLMPDAVLDDPGFPAARERMWTSALTSGRYRQLAGPPRPRSQQPPADWCWRYWRAWRSVLRLPDATARSKLR
jgi:hypothetical protein